MSEKIRQKLFSWKFWVFFLCLSGIGIMCLDLQADSTYKDPNSPAGTEWEIWVDIDADNDNGFDEPDRTPAERSVKDEANDIDKPGKIIFTNEKDADGDRIPDLADGYNLDGRGENYVSNTAENFAQVQLTFNNKFDIDKATVKITYPDSPPAVAAGGNPGMTVSPQTDYPLVQYTPPAAAGDNQRRIRIWNVSGATDRNGGAISGGGNFYKSGDEIALKDLIVWTDPGHTMSSNWDATNRRLTLWVEGIRASVDPGDVIIKVEVDTELVSAVAPVHAFVAKMNDQVRVMVQRASLLVDTNRSGDISEDDRLGKDIFWKTKGAILAVNSDNDRNEDDARPAATPPDPTAPERIKLHDYEDDSVAPINNDESDLARLLIGKIKALPTGWKVTLKVSTDDADRIRIFDHTVAARVARIGPLAAGKKESYDIPDADIKGADLTFAAEGLKYVAEEFPVGAEVFAGLIDVTLEVTDGNTPPNVMGTDTATFKIAPFLMLGHAEKTELVYVTNYDLTFVGDNSSGFTKLVKDAGADMAPIIDSVTYPDRWAHDAFEIGYVRTPGSAGTPTPGMSMHVVDRLPRAEALKYYPDAVLLAPDIGHFNSPDYTSSFLGDFGGNIELTTPTTAHPHGILYMGDKSIGDPNVPYFFALQGVQGRRDNGVVTAAAADSITDAPAGSPKAWADGTGGNEAKQWASDAGSPVKSWVTITGGKGKGQTRLVEDNEATKLKVTPNWATVPDKTSIYHVSSVLILPTDWLWVGHVDEVVNFTPEGKLLVDDPNLGLKLLCELAAKKEETVNATGGSANTITANTGHWGSNDLVDGYVYIHDGKGKGQIRRITTNSTPADFHFELKVTRDWDVIPDTTSKFSTYALKATGEAETQAMTVTDKFQDTDKLGSSQEWQGGFVEITSGAMSGQVRQIQSHSDDVATVTRDWTPAILNGGTATAVTATTLTSSIALTPDVWKGAMLIIAGPSAQVVTVTGNTATTIEVASWQTPPGAPSIGNNFTLCLLSPNASSTYALMNRGVFRAMFFKEEEKCTLPTASATNNKTDIVDSTNTYANDEWNNGVAIVYQSGPLAAPAIRKITKTYAPTTETGTTTAGTTTVLTDTGKSWNANRLVGGTLTLTSGTYNGQSRIIRSHGADAITVEEAFPGAVGAGVTYSISVPSKLVLDPALPNTIATSDRVVIAKKPLFWDEFQLAPQEIATVTVGELLTEVDDLNFQTYYYPPGGGPPEPRANGANLATKCQIVYDVIWKKKPKLSDTGFKEKLRFGMGGDTVLPDDKIIPMPSLFASFDTFISPMYAVAYSPGMVNSNMITNPGGVHTAIFSDPFVAHNTEGKDVFKKHVEGIFTGTSIPIYKFIDDWKTYHIGSGEVHCGTNQKRRIPKVSEDDKKWWENWAE